MGNSRSARRKLNGELDTEPADEPLIGAGEAGSVNGYACRDCNGVTMVIHKDAGVTPMFLSCRTPGCNGTGRSLMYPRGVVSENLRKKIKWEWYKPADTDSIMNDPEVRDHIRRGGLALRELVETPV